MHEALIGVFSRYRPRGIFCAKEFLLVPKDALELLDDIDGLGVLAFSVGTWYCINRHRDWMVETWDRNFNAPDSVIDGHDVAESIRLARRYIQNDLTDVTEFVSFVLDVPLEIDLLP